MPRKRKKIDKRLERRRNGFEEKPGYHKPGSQNRNKK